MYTISVLGSTAHKKSKESSLSEDEIKILDFINENGSINNQQSIDKLAFGKDKNVTLFNSLIKKQTHFVP